MFIWPMYRMVKNIRQRGRLPDMKAKRVYATVAVAAGLVAVFFLLPAADQPGAARRGWSTWTPDTPARSG